MMRRFALGLALLLLVAPGAAWAQKGPERLLPAGSQFYFHFEGFDKHREAFDKTALGKMLKGDTGKFLVGVGSYIGEIVDSFLGEDPDSGKVFKDVLQVLSEVGKNGIALGVAVKSITPPDVQATAVLPKGGEGRLLPLIKRAVNGGEIKETKVGKTTIFHVEPTPGLRLGWWNDAGDAVFTIGTHDAVDVAKALHEGVNITGHPLYKEVRGFDEFTTCARAYVDLAGIAKIVRGINPDVAKLVDATGLDGIKSITFQAGFDGPFDRSVLEVNMPGPRNGLLKLTSPKKIKLADLPPLPDDLTSFSASSLGDAAAAYEALVDTVEAAVRLFSPRNADRVKGVIGKFEDAAGISIKNDLFGSLGDMVVSYNSPGEGVLGLGTVYLVKVKDAKTLQKSLEGLFRGLGKIPGVELTVKKRAYEGTDVHEIHFGRGVVFPYVPSFAVHKGWLTVSYFPQPIKGFILRTNGELPKWDIETKMAKGLAPFPKEFVSVSMKDPRPTVRFLLTVAPPAFQLANSLTSQFFPGFPKMDVGIIPNAHEATRHLFPNISVTTDDGKKLRIETRASLSLPF